MGKKLHELLEASGTWDRVRGLQVTNAAPRTLELRAVMSGPDSGAAWNLRCLVREELVRYLSGRYPEILPRARAELHGVELEPRGRGSDGHERARTSPPPQQTTKGS